MSLLGADVGTTGLKAVAYDADSGRPLASAYRQYPLLHRRPSWIEVDPRVVWDAFAECAQHVNAAESVTADPVTALALSVSADEVFPVSRAGEPLDYCIMAADPRGVEILPIIRRHFSDLDLFQRTGVPLHNMFPLVRMLWWKTEKPAVFENAFKFVSWEEFLLMKLGLPAVSDHTSTSRWIGFDIHKRAWDHALFNALDIPVGLLPDTGPSGTPIGSISSTIARELGFAAAPTMVLGAFDQACMALGAGAYAPGTAVVSTGTWEVVTSVVARPPDDEAALRRGLVYSCSTHSDWYVGMAGNPGGGIVLRWFRDVLDGQGLRPDAEPESYEAMLSTVSARPSRLLFLPHLQGAHNPWMDSRSKGAMVGLTLETSRADVLRAILEGITYELFLNLEALKAAGSAVGRLIATGGGARSGAWLQVKADVLGVPVDTLNVEETGCLGAALLAGWGTGVYRSTERAQQRFVHTRHRWEPNVEHTETYRHKLNLYTQLYKDLAGLHYALEA